MAAAQAFAVPLCSARVFRGIARALFRAVRFVLAPLAAASLTACLFGPSYRPGALSDAPNGESYANARRPSECLDLAVWTIASREVWPRVLLRFDFGNRCDRTIDVDFTALKVTATCGRVGETVLSPYDPRHAIVPGRLVPLGYGAELIAFGANECPELPHTVCVDVSRMAGARATLEGDEGKVCFPQGSDGFVVREGIVR
jgi:hypothetical protein